MSASEQTSTPLDARIAGLVERARSVVGQQPSFVVRAPGRVNLLGEHTDYNMLPVLPMAIERCVLIAGAARDDRTVRLHNTGTFSERSFEITSHIPKFVEGDWGNYAKAAAQGLVDYSGIVLRHGADLLVDGDIPAGAGLSSSSALVVACALALLAANDDDIPFETLAEILPKAERYVGTLSGGMDQAVSLLAQAGHALRIDFAPLRCRPVPLPARHAIVVCHSLVQAEKSGLAKHAYNQRVIECRLACRVLEKMLAGRLDARLMALGDLVSIFPSRPLPRFVDDLAARVPDEPLDLGAIAGFAGVSEDDLRRDCEIPREQEGRFTLVARARHVLTEADRVERAEAALLEGDAAAFGDLMDASHRSCRDDYEISCPELETLVDLAKNAGALGARLTGAGFGGCTVNLIAHDRVGEFIDAVDAQFYGPHLQAGGVAGDVRFVFTPQAGAELTRF
jgi:N-acetylgalactosamine kinase